ncbi:MAG: PaaI family thioesterase, partial [Steroidobacteraceae bacterium]
RVDIAGDFALIAVLGHGVPTINFRVDYLRPAVGTDLIERAQVRRPGRTVGVVDIEVEDGNGRLVAIGRGCYGTRAG